uniref:Uncharacterized protein n=1 Tax=viral metagenome TaxID=1070528 RepID=A0A6M3JIG2_9ZZZZ
MPNQAQREHTLIEEERFCLFCGGVLPTKHKSRKYCSKQCKNKAFGANYKRSTGRSHSFTCYHKRKDSGLCAHCGKTPVEKGKAYCPRCSSLKAKSDTNARRKLKQRVIETYGGKCTCCGETHFEFLGIDHVYGGGKAHRDSLRKVGNEIYRWLELQGFPKDKFRLLCHNCNISLGQYGYCPHQGKNGSSGTEKVNI